MWTDLKILAQEHGQASAAVATCSNNETVQVSDMKWMVMCAGTECGGWI